MSDNIADPRRSGLVTTATGPSICPASEIGPKEDHPQRKIVLGDVLPATTPILSSQNSTPAGVARCLTRPKTSSSPIPVARPATRRYQTVSMAALFLATRDRISRSARPWGL
ncbi:hypothetical protein KL918_001773 [Ogataea parapolymorpha]|nr:hypothetical protein KL918_001773 [Ogataea parapolymorpha]KAG7874265.1 hypothetical protein KL916_001605 [Ogataea parapolymorpha]